MFLRILAALVFVVMGVAPVEAENLCDIGKGWTIVQNYPEPQVYQANVRISDVQNAIYLGSIPEPDDSFGTMLVADAPKLKFIPICESLPPGSGTIECIRESQVQGQATLTAWRAASLKLLNSCVKVIIDKTKPKSDPTNIGFKCNGILTGAGLIPDPQE